jgi:hypothetical protein
MPVVPEFLAAARDWRIAAGYRYWLAKKEALAGDLIPGRQHIHADEMVAFLPHVLLFDIERTGEMLRFRHRLTGSHFYELFGKEVTGLYVEQAGSAEAGAIVHERFSSIVRTKQPIYGVAPVAVKSREFLQYEHLTLPLASDGQIIDMLFGIRCALPPPAG